MVVPTRGSGQTVPGSLALKWPAPARIILDLHSGQALSCHSAVVAVQGPLAVYFGSPYG